MLGIYTTCFLFLRSMDLQDQISTGIERDDSYLAGLLLLHR